MKKISIWLKNNPILLFLILFILIFILGKETLKISDSLFQFALSVGFFTWLIKAIGDQYFKKELEIHKYELNLKSTDYKAEINSRLETYKAELNNEIKRHESNLKLNGEKAISLYMKRIDIMSELYEKLSKAEYPLHALTRRFKIGSSEIEMENTEQKQIIDFEKNFNDFAEYYEGKKIFFSQDLCKELDKLQREMVIISRDYGMKNQNFEIYREACEKMDNEIPHILKKVEDEFRLLLGVVEIK